jgi:hypothetical protein
MLLVSLTSPREYGTGRTDGQLWIQSARMTMMR